MIWLILVSCAAPSSELFSDPFDLDAERHIALAMVGELREDASILLAELELAHVYSPSNVWVTHRLSTRLMFHEANLERAREIIATAMRYDPESPWLNRIYAVFEIVYGEVTPTVQSSVWRMIEDPTMRELGYGLLRQIEEESFGVSAAFRPESLKATDTTSCSYQAFTIQEPLHSDPSWLLPVISKYNKECRL